MNLARRFQLAAAAALLVAAAGCARATAGPSGAGPVATASGAAAGPAAPPARASQRAGAPLTVLFKFDPGATYGGASWRPTPFATGLKGGVAVIEAKVERVDEKGHPRPVAARWAAADPSMVTVAEVTPGRPDLVRLSVQRAGESTLTVSAGESSRVLRIQAQSPLANALRVRITE